MRTIRNKIETLPASLRGRREDKDLPFREGLERIVYLVKLNLTLRPKSCVVVG